MPELPPPFDRELVVVAGKGGVGKTTTAAAVAMRAARSGRRTLLVTIDPAQRLEDALGVPVGHRVKPVAENLHAMMLDPEKAIRDYLAEVAPDRDLTQHPLFKYISNYMPGLNELLAIGQLIEFRREKDFRTIVVDTAPTGHALTFLTTPMKVRDLLRENLVIKWAIRGYAVYQKVSRRGRDLTKMLRGLETNPQSAEVDLEGVFTEVSERVGEINELLQDARRTSLLLVTLPEKLPVEETMDLHEYVAQTLKIPVAALVVNKVAPDALEGGAPAIERLRRDEKTLGAAAKTIEAGGHPKKVLRSLLQAAQFHESRRTMNLHYTAELERRLPRVPQFRVPLQASDVHGRDRLQQFEDELFAAVVLAAPAR